MPESVGVLENQPRRDLFPIVHETDVPAIVGCDQYLNVGVFDTSIRDDPMLGSDASKLAETKS